MADSKPMSAGEGAALGFLFAMMPLVLTGMFSSCCAENYTHDQWRKETVARGVAEYYMTARGPVWRWKKEHVPGVPNREENDE